MKGGLFTLSADGGRREEEKGGKRKGGATQRKSGRGAEGESEDSCADNHTLLTFVWPTAVSKDK